MTNRQIIQKSFLASIFLLLGICSAADGSESLYRNSKVKSLNPATMQTITKELYNNWKELEKRHLALLPVPKKIEFKGNPITLDENTVIVLKKNTNKGEIAVREINSMVKEYSGKELAVLSVPQDGKYNIIIDNIFPDSFSERQEKLIKTKNPFKFGNDMVTADYTVIKTYIAAIKKINANTKLGVILYPYTPLEFVPETALKHFNMPNTLQYRKYVEESIAKTCRYMRELMEKLPPDTRMTIREGKKVAVEAILQGAIGDNPCEYYFQPWISTKYMWGASKNYLETYGARI